LVRTKDVETQGATATLARFAISLTYEDLPAEVVDLLKRMLLDTLGTTLAANTLGEGCRELITFARKTGGTPECTLIGLGDKVPASIAALVNGGLAHALNYDVVGAGHLGLIPISPLAAAERAGASGSDLLAAIAAGCEITARINLAVKKPNEQALAGQLLGYFGAAAGAGRVMHLDQARMESAFGLALMQTAGARQVSVVGGEPPAKAIYGGFPNHGGMIAALLAEEGLGAECDALEGKAGLYALYYGGDFDEQTLTEGLGDRYLAMGANFKPWATSGIVNPFIEAALDLCKTHSLKAPGIRSVHIRGGRPAQHWIEPAEERKRPANGAAAANSVYFAVAKALVNGEVSLSDFTPEGLVQPDALAFTDRMDHSIDDALGHSAVLELVLESGENLVGRVDVPLGSPAKPMSQEQIVAKFLDCARFASAPIATSRLEQVIDLVGRLEQIDDVRALTELLTPNR
jgi:2-methylcitrate dehydratase PrpD